MELFNGMFGKIAPGMCRLAVNGEIAIKTSSGYKTFNVKTNRLTNCSNFVFDAGEDFFFLIPTKKVSAGDIILVNGKPRCVMKKDGDIITVMNFEDSVIENILPERQIFMGNTYFFGKIVSIFGKQKGKGSMNKIMRYMMISEMLKGKGDKKNDGMNPMMLMMMSGGGMGDIFDGIFDDENDENDSDDMEGED